ncbi:MAG: hypothetical protein SFV32_00395 [Opitutaceae bacterium]|nr:hypothetical protein [Opitutaceae bacterium]
MSASMKAGLPQFHVVGFTGHRSLPAPEAVAGAIRSLLSDLRAQGQGEWIAMASIAAGADRVFVEESLAAGLGWEAVLPLPEIDFERDFSPEEWRLVKTLLNRAELIETVHENGTREEGYLSAGLHVVNGCDVLVAVWDGLPARGTGGTAEIVAYARALDKPLAIISPTDGAVTWENRQRLALHDHNLAELNSVACDGEPPAVAAFERLVGFQAKVDHAATSKAPHFRHLIAGTIWLHVGATTLATLALSLHWHSPAIPWIKLLLLIGALGVAVYLRNQRTHHEWMRCRLAAEISRSALAIWGLPRSSRLFAEFDWAGLEPLRRALDVLHRRSAKSQRPDFVQFRARYIAERVDGQLAYFARQEARATPLLARLRLGFAISSFGALGCTLLYSLNATFHWESPAWMEDIVYHFLPIVLPVVAAAFISLISVNDLHRRVARYREMRLRLEAGRRELAHCPSWPSFERAVAKVERFLLHEVFEWHSITSFTESH